MKRLALFVAILAMPLVLSACKNTNSATSTYSGAALSKKKVKSAKEIRRTASKKRKALLPRNELTKGADASERRTALFPLRSRDSRNGNSANRKAASKRRNASSKQRSASSKPRREGRVVRGSYKKRKAAYRKLIAKHARAHGVPMKLAMAVVHVESAYNPKARGAAGEVGMMQLMPATARMMGYRGKMRNLYNPGLNLHYGMKYLGKAYRLGGGSYCRAVLKYNAGHGAKRWNPISRRYCNKVKRLTGRG